MTYTFSTVTPTPSWVTVNPATGLATIDSNAAPPNGFNGIARFRVGDGTSESFQEFSLQVLPRYSVALDYREVDSVRYRAIATAKALNQALPIAIKYRAIATAKIIDTVQADNNVFNKYRAIALAKIRDTEIPSNAVTIYGDLVTVDGDFVTVN